MQIKQVHAHFLISIGNYSNERIGFTVELEEGETPEQAVEQLRQRAIAIVGETASTLYDEKYQALREYNEITKKLNLARSEWDATAEFLKAQGIRTDAPAMPKFSKLLSAAVEEETVVEGEFSDSDIPL